MSEPNKMPALEHASRPGIISYILLAGLLIVYFVVAYRPSIESFLGVQF
jgi:hypothetical protein